MAVKLLLLRMTTSWDRMALVIDRYERMATQKISELKRLQRIAMNGGDRDNEHHRHMIAQCEDQLKHGLEAVIKLRNDIDAKHFDAFDAKIEPIRKQIKTCLEVTQALPPVKSTNPFEEDIEEENPYEVESQRYMASVTQRDAEMARRVEEAREKAEGTKKIQQEMEDLEQIFAELAKIVHEQHDMVDSIEEQVERASEDVKRGNEQLKQAVKSKATKAPLIAGIVGGLAAGGPVGIAAGSAIAGITAGVGGLVAGVYTGRFFKRSATNN